MALLLLTCHYSDCEIVALLRAPDGLDVPALQKAFWKSPECRGDTHDENMALFKARLLERHGCQEVEYTEVSLAWL